MKDSHFKNNKIAKCLIAGTSVVSGVVLLICGVLFFRNEAEESTGVVVEEKAQTEISVEYVKGQENAAQADDGQTSDNKKTIKIIEVIPHDICSVFPYMVDWGVEEEYNKNTPLGYEGIRFMMSKYNIAQTRGSQGMLSNKASGISTDTLLDYNIQFVQGGGEWEPGCWRKYEETQIRNMNGYFMYVGEGKGLYHLNTAQLAENSNDLGIHYAIRAMERKASEGKKGRYEVSNAGYYWAKDCEGISYPTNDIKQKTEYNYDLSFSCEGGNGTYRVYNVATKNQVLGGIGDYSYEAKLATNAQWDGGYEYQLRGNYVVKSVRPYHVTDLNEDFSGKYLRIENRDKTDNVADHATGYFKLYEGSDKESIRIGTVLYQVTFEEAAEGITGTYRLNENEVMNRISADAGNGAVYKDILFRYAGEGKGNYDVSFIYVGSHSYEGEKYTEELLEVSNKKGRYALTSTTPMGEELYSDVGKGNGDYVKAVTSIDCEGIEYPMGSSRVGVRSATDNQGSWVFYTVASDEINGITEIENLPVNGSPAVGTRIYVYGQNRKKCYYQQNGFVNNEWFKLLVYMTAKDGSGALAQKDYAEGSLSGPQIVEKYKAELEEFDQTYKIEVIQRTPGELKPEEVDEADLIYISDIPGLSGIETIDKINNRYCWDYIGEVTNRNLEPYNGQTLEFSDDFSAQTLEAIYRNCLYHTKEDTPHAAIMFDMAKYSNRYISGESSKVTKNLGKLVYLVEFFEDPMYFAQFMPGYEEYNENYSAITFSEAVELPEKNDVNVTVYDNYNQTYNLGKKYIALENSDHVVDEEIEPVTELEWNEKYFIVPYIYFDDATQRWRVNDWGMGLYGGSDRFPFGIKNAYTKDPEEGWTWWVPDDIVKIFKDGKLMKNVWSIMHSRTSRESSTPVVIVTNADGVSEQVMESQILTYYIYIDAYEALNETGGTYPDFDIQYKINWTPEEVKEPNGLVTVTVSRLGGGELASQASPNYQEGYLYNTAGDFLKDGVLNPEVAQQDYIITATDEKGKVGSAVVKVILREAFLLN